MSVQIAAITAEHHESGFGLGHSRPRISWRYADASDPTKAAGWVQAGYELTITRPGSKPEVFTVDSEDQTLVTWPSSPLTSRSRATVSVRAKGRDGDFTNTATMEVEAGLLDRSDWTAEMISAPEQPLDAPKAPFRLFKTFTLSSVPTAARLYATAHGLYEARINGKVVGDHVLSPGWTSYAHHLNYQVFDVTPLLQQGDNTIEATIGEGWYATRLGRPGTRNVWGSRLGFLGQLEVGGKTAVHTDSTWSVGRTAILSSEIYNGESFDSTLTESDTSAPTGPTEVVDFPKAQLVATDAPPVRRVKEVKPVEKITTPSGKTVIDFGQNLVGWIRVERDLEGKKGGKMVIKFAEVLEHGELGTRPLRTAEATDTVELGGKTAGWEPKFTFHGFRYAEISGLSSVDLSDFTAVVITSDMRRTGTFHSSHALLNRLHENVVWGMMSNFVSVPTDCPQRDERLGWTGDIQVFAPTANYLFDTAGFLSGWLRDVAAEQKTFDGIPPTVVPFVPPNSWAGKKPRPHAVWADCVAITPWDLYNAFGDAGVLEQQYESMCLWLDKGLPRESNGMWKHDAPQYGDWLDPRAPPQYPAHGRTDTHLCANAYMVYTTGLVATIAEILGKSADAKRYKADYEKYKALFQNEYVTPSGRLTSDTQTAFALALKFGLVPDDKVAHARDRLEWLIRWDYFKISTGFAGTPIILPVLAAEGLLQTAYRMLQERDNPSWLYSVTMGATTIWERWDSMLPDGTINPGQMTSFNHYALGACAAFMHETVAGLAPLTPGWKSALIRPRPGGTITSASGRFDSPIGPYAVSWRLDAPSTTNGNSVGGEEKRKMTVDVDVPPNGSARVVLNGVDEVVPCGKKTFVVDWKPEGEWPPQPAPGPQATKIPDEYVP